MDEWNVEPPAAEHHDTGVAMSPLVDGAAFRAAMRHFAGTVSVVTTGRGAARTGFAATSVCPLSVERPTLLVCLDGGASSWPVLKRYRTFCVNVLADDQAVLADRFAGRGGISGAARYDGTRWRELTTGALAFADALLAFDCVLEEAIERHSHAILVGRVVALSVRGAGEPLLYKHGAYRRLAG